MAEEKSIFSKLKPISIGDDKSGGSSPFKSQQESTENNQPKTSDPLLKNDIDMIKEKIAFIEKSISDISKVFSVSTPSQIKEEIVKDIKNTVNEEVLKCISGLSKEISDTINKTVSALKDEIIKMVKEDVKHSIEKNMQVIESLKNLNSKDFEKLEHISVKLDMIMKIYEKIKGFEEIGQWLKNDMSTEFKKVGERLENVSVKLESKILDEISKNVERVAYDKLSEIRENLIKEFQIIEALLKEEIRKNVTLLSDDITLISRKMDDCRKAIEYVSSLKEKITQPELEMIAAEIGVVNELFTDFRTRLYNDEELTNNISVKKYIGVMVEMESKLNHIKGMILAIIKNLK